MESDSPFPHRRERSLEVVDHEAGAIRGPGHLRSSCLCHGGRRGFVSRRSRFPPERRRSTARRATCRSPARPRRRAAGARLRTRRPRRRLSLDPLPDCVVNDSVGAPKARRKTCLLASGSQRQQQQGGTAAYVHSARARRPGRGCRRRRDGVGGQRQWRQQRDAHLACHDHEPDSSHSGCTGRTRLAAAVTAALRRPLEQGRRLGRRRDRESRRGRHRRGCKQCAARVGPADPRGCEVRCYRRRGGQSFPG